MGTEFKDIERVQNTLASLKAGGIIINQFGFASDTKQIVARDATGYYTMAGLEAANVFTVRNTFNAGITLPTNVTARIGDNTESTEGELYADGPNTSIKLRSSVAGVDVDIETDDAADTVNLQGVLGTPGLINHFTNTNTTSAVSYYGKSNSVRRKIEFRASGSKDGRAEWTGSINGYYFDGDVEIPQFDQFKLGSTGRLYSDASYMYLTASDAKSVYIGGTGAIGASSIWLVPGGWTSKIISSTSSTASSETLSDNYKIHTGTTTGLQVATTSLQKLGFHGVTPITQTAAIPNADGTLADITTKFNNLLAAQKNVGLMGT
jgi:hypothetical protein